jgi:hypothetical protein
LGIGWLDSAVPDASATLACSPLDRASPAVTLIAYKVLCDQLSRGAAEMSGKIVRLRHPKIVRNATRGARGRQANSAYRVREHLTEAEMEKLLAALKRNRRNYRAQATHA